MATNFDEVINSDDEPQIRIIDSSSNRDTNSQTNSFLNLRKFIHENFQLRSSLFKEFLAELIGTLILVTFIISSNAQLKFTSQLNPNISNGFAQAFSSGIGNGIGILVAGKISGAHLNPAVSFAMVLNGKLTLKKLIVYILGQMIGAFLAAGLVFLVYFDAFRNNSSGMHSYDTATIFATYPRKDLSILGAFFDQIVASTFLISTILAVSDGNNMNLNHYAIAPMVSLTVAIIGCSFGFNSGAAMNPARDLAPRFFTLISGWGIEPFTSNSYFFWIPIVCPMIASLIATCLYNTLISAQLLN